MKDLEKVIRFYAAFYVIGALILISIAGAKSFLNAFDGLF